MEVGDRRIARKNVAKWMMDDQEQDLQLIEF